MKSGGSVRNRGRVGDRCLPYSRKSKGPGRDRCRAEAESRAEKKNPALTKRWLVTAVLLLSVLLAPVRQKPGCAELAEREAVASPCEETLWNTGCRELDEILNVAHAQDGERERTLYQQCEAFEENGSLSCPSEESASAFLTYYISDYCIANTNRMTFFIRRGSGIQLLPGKENRNDRVANTKAILKTFGTCREKGDRETVRATCLRVRRKFHFSYDYTYTGLSKSVLDGYGVCEQYARIAYVLLNAEGIPTRTRIGCRDGSSFGHIWNECRIGDSGEMVDFCVFSDRTISPDGFVSESAAAHYHPENIAVE